MKNNETQPMKTASPLSERRKTSLLLLNRSPNQGLGKYSLCKYSISIVSVKKLRISSKKITGTPYKKLPNTGKKITTCIPFLHNLNTF
jgi:hypothetical protein